MKFCVVVAGNPPLSHSKTNTFVTRLVALNLGND